VKRMLLLHSKINHIRVGRALVQGFLAGDQAVMVQMVQDQENPMMIQAEMVYHNFQKQNQSKIQKNELKILKHYFVEWKKILIQKVKVTMNVKLEALIPIRQIT
jgi:hypothetical protein